MQQYRVIRDPFIDIRLPKKPEIRESYDDVLTAAEGDRLVGVIRSRRGR